MILLSFAAIALLSNVAIAVPYNGKCDSATPCSEANNVCVQQSSCSKGLCACASGYTRVIGSTNSSCEPDIWLGEKCTTYCSAGVCTSGTCRCRQGFVGSSDNRRCVGKALGDTCTTVADCEGYTTGGGITCSGTCQCLPGYKPYNSNSCTWHSDGDTCTPGTTECSPLQASCANDTKTCTCDTVAGIKYVWMTYTVLGMPIGGCIHPKSTRNLGQGETCTVNNYGETARLCADNYVCDLCPESTAPNYECLSTNGVGQTRASSLIIVAIFLLGIKTFTA